MTFRIRMNGDRVKALPENHNGIGVASAAVGGGAIKDVKVP